MRWTKGVIKKKNNEPKPFDDVVGALNDEYCEARNEIIGYYLEAIMQGDINTQKDLTLELDEIKEQYSSDLNDLLSE